MNSKWLWSKLNILKPLYAYQRLDWSHVFLLKPTKDPALAAWLCPPCSQWPQICLLENRIGAWPCACKEKQCSVNWLLSINSGENGWMPPRLVCRSLPPSGCPGCYHIVPPLPSLTWGNKINLSDVMNVKLAQICHNYSLTLHCVQLLTQINLTHIDKGRECCSAPAVQRRQVISDC